MNEITRRETLKAGSALSVAIGASYYMDLIETAYAQSSTEPRIQLGQDWEIDDYDDGNGNTNLRIRHIPTNAELKYDVLNNKWIMENLEIGNRNINNLSVTAVLSSAQTVSDSTTEIVEFDTILGNDDFGAFDTSTHKFTVPANNEGDYFAVVNIQWKADSSWNTGDRIEPQWRINSSAKAAPSYRKVGTAKQSSSFFYYFQNLTDGDKIEAAIFQKSGSSKVIEPSNIRTYMFIYYVG